MKATFQQLRDHLSIMGQEFRAFETQSLPALMAPKDHEIYVRDVQFGLSSRLSLEVNFITLFSDYIVVTFIGGYDELRVFHTEQYEWRVYKTIVVVE